MSAEPQTLFQALVAVQAEMPAIQRDKINPAFRSKYLSLETLLAEVLPVLNRHGLAVSQWPSFVISDQGEVIPTLETTLVHGPSGEVWKGVMPLFPAKKDPQGLGSAITYAKRYALMALLGISADEDDDGNAASTKAATKAKPKPTPANATMISEAQRKRLFTVATASGVTEARVKEIVKAIATVDSSKDIPRDKYDAIVSAIEAEKIATAA